MHSGSRVVAERLVHGEWWRERPSPPQGSRVYQIADCMLRCAEMRCALLPLLLGGGRDAIFHILQSCIGRPEITAVDLLRLRSPSPTLHNCNIPTSHALLPQGDT